MPRRDLLPDFVDPQLALLVKHAPEGDSWVHEIKLASSPSALSWTFALVNWGLATDWNPAR